MQRRGDNDGAVVRRMPVYTGRRVRDLARLHEVAAIITDGIARDALGVYQ